MHYKQILLRTMVITMGFNSGELWDENEHLIDFLFFIFYRSYFFLVSVGLQFGTSHIPTSTSYHLSLGSSMRIWLKLVKRYHWVTRLGLLWCSHLIGQKRSFWLVKRVLHCVNHTLEHFKVEDLWGLEKTFFNRAGGETQFFFEEALN